MRKVDFALIGESTFSYIYILYIKDLFDKRSDIQHQCGNQPYADHGGDKPGYKLPFKSFFCAFFGGDVLHRPLILSNFFCDLAFGLHIFILLIRITHGICDLRGIGSGLES